MTTTTQRPAHSHWGRSIGIAVAAAAVVALVLLAFVWPTITSTVKDIPLAISGSAQQVTAVTKALDSRADGAFDITRVADRKAAIDLIDTRDAYGAIILGDSPEVIEASANGAAVSQILSQLAPVLQAQANAAAQQAVGAAIAAGKAPAGTVAPTITVKVTDAVPLASTDARGLGLTAAAFPLVLGGMLGGILIALLVTGAWRRLTAVAVYAIVAGFGIVSIMQGWFGVLQGDYIVNVGAVALAMAATASFIVGVNALVGRAGIAVGSVVTMLIGNPLSSAAQPIQFLAGGWGAVGQWFVPGASMTLVRDLSYFPDANPTFAWLVLAGWTVLGLLAMVVGHFRNQDVVTTDEQLEVAPAHPVHKHVAV